MSRLKPHLYIICKKTWSYPQWPKATLVNSSMCLNRNLYKLAVNTANKTLPRAISRSTQSTKLDPVNNPLFSFNDKEMLILKNKKVFNQFISKKENNDLELLLNVFKGFKTTTRTECWCSRQTMLYKPDLSSTRKLKKTQVHQLQWLKLFTKCKQVKSLKLKKKQNLQLRLMTRSWIKERWKTLLSRIIGCKSCCKDKSSPKLLFYHTRWSLCTGRLDHAVKN